MLENFIQGTVEFYQELLKLFDPRFEEEVVDDNN